MWQQQMQLMETFHNDMIMMVQMFIAMHREHLASVRDELDHVQELTRELTRLNARLGQLPAVTEGIPAAPTGRRRRELGRAPQAGASTPGGNPPPRPAQPTADRPAGKPPDEAGKLGPAGGPASKGRDAGKPQARPSPALAREEIYADLTRRITELQRERQGHWQKILKAING
jgi:hypothetical protein